MRIAYLWILLWYVGFALCTQEVFWEQSEANQLLVYQCDSGFVYRICNSDGSWEDAVDRDCKEKKTLVYRGVFHGLPIEPPRLIKSLPNDMDMTCLPTSSMTFTFSQSGMHRGDGSGFLQTDRQQIQLDAIPWRCTGSTCSLSFANLLPLDELIYVHLDKRFFVSAYNVSLDKPIDLLFQTQPQECNTEMIREGATTHHCQCMNVE
ncbi:hypothetical protein WA588_002979, partial [Blastocystis sp. NMH]